MPDWKVLSSTVIGQDLTGGPTENETRAYMIDREIGASLLTTPLLHYFDSVCEGSP